MHVSPFQPMEQSYEISVGEPGEQLRVGIRNLEARQRGLRRVAGAAPARADPSTDGRAAAALSADDDRDAGAHLRERGQAQAQGRTLPPPSAERGAVSARSRGAVHAVLAPDPIGADRAATRPTRAAAKRFGPPDAQLRAAIRVHDPRFYEAVARRRSVGLGESYADGLWDTHDLVALLRIGAREMFRLDPARRRLAPVTRPVQRLAMLPLLNTRRGARRNIAAHYDLGNEMFETFLDSESMMYSSACFEHEDQSLEEAQRHKLERICRAPRAEPRRPPARDRHRLGRPRRLRRARSTAAASRRRRSPASSASTRRAGCAPPASRSGSPSSSADYRDAARAASTSSSRSR